MINDASKFHTFHRIERFSIENTTHRSKLAIRPQPPTPIRNGLRFEWRLSRHSRDGGALEYVVIFFENEREIFDQIRYCSGISFHRAPSGFYHRQVLDRGASGKSGGTVVAAAAAAAAAEE